ncbi:LOW QUALITY PROTEIN: non-structural maintenance of chromosomes element 1 homolog [Drosophila gunungcola]|uniref:LOW QUALITY PROTEIN: non-structural maintenance of chromosomes element 1 homolog n=1 Tax=Drosophila gunungcola TaxID=103775 RepID=UPI0022E5CBF1|nr:LOW QUALITY PROTEIN: non-structural maintenance of chromosomes element 1 homolog [Drosophila gunungcola]
MDVVKRGFVRACKNHSYLSYELIDNILGPLCAQHQVSKPSSKEAVKAFVGEINDSISDLGQSLVFIKYPIKTEEYLVYAKTDATPDSVASTGLTAEECQYFSKLLDKIAAEEDCHIPWNAAYSEVLLQGSSKPVKKSRMQELLQKWTQMGYFMELDERIYLGPRSLVELNFYLTSHHTEHIKNCMLCKCLVLWDIRCGSCHIQFHRECIHTYLQRRDICPSCGNLWTTPLRRSTSSSS